MVIKDIELKIIPDSRGKDTLSAQIKTSSLLGELMGEAAVPSGKSTGIHETFVLDPQKALEKLKEIKHLILEKDFNSQEEFDNYLIQIDATENKSNLGGNLILALSLSFARLKAQNEGRELFEYIRENIRPSGGKERLSGIKIFPYPMLNVINGGAHADNILEFQEFQIIPQAESFAACMESAKKLYAELGEKIKNRFKDYEIKLGDEAGYSAPFESNEEAIKFLYEIIKKGNYNIRIGLDVAATHFFQEDGHYLISGKKYSSNELLVYYKHLTEKYEIISIEDPFAEEEFNSFAELMAESNAERKNIMVITDDLTTTNLNRLETAINNKAGNAILIKLNQIGTLSETLRVIEKAYENGWQVVVSHRSGETKDDFIGDLAMAARAWGIKSGAPATDYRMNKYERVQKILDMEE